MPKKQDKQEPMQKVRPEDFQELQAKYVAANEALKRINTYSCCLSVHGLTGRQLFALNAIKAVSYRLADWDVQSDHDK